MNPVYHEVMPILDMDSILENLIADVPWFRVTETRQECFMALEPTSYTYGQRRGERSYESTEMSPFVLNIMQILNQAISPKQAMTGCFLNRYDDASQHLGWHADDFVGMDHSAPVIVVSFGEPREIWWRPNGTRGETPPECRQLLKPGSVFIMPPGMQHSHQHRIPKGDRPMGPRVSLTYRRFL